MPEDYENDVILPDGFDPEKGWIDDATPEEPAPTTEEAPAETDESAEQPVEAAEPTTTPEPEVKQPTVKVKFNHEERELSLDEAAILAQKGLNYDKVMERLNGFEATNAKSLKLAKNLGYESAEEMLSAAEQNYINRQVRELMDAGNTEAMARFLVEQKMAKEEQPAPAPQPQAPQPEAPRIPQERIAELKEFVDAYPGITKLPDEVIQANRNGVRLLVAYERYKNKAALDELAILKQNQAAAAKAPVSGTVGKTAPPAPDINDDPFMKGFNNSYPR